MENDNALQYAPDYLVTPGEVLEDYLEHLSMSQAELANRTGLAKKTINEIIKGKSPITPETALKFEMTLGRPAQFWNNVERRFQENRVRLVAQQRYAENVVWLKRFPVREMLKLGWIAKRATDILQLEEMLRFFGIASPEQWDSVWQGHQAVAYRQTKRFEKKEEAISAWLRQGEILVQQVECEPFDKKRFLEILGQIRMLTTEQPEVFEPRLQELCASSGVAVVFVPELPKTGVYGATRWLGDKATIQLSLRYKSNDHLWFTFFHEAGHIVKHGRKDVFIEANGHDDPKEQEANEFASDMLIPRRDFQRLVRAGRPPLASIERFATEIGLAPGIVVGRLQHEELLPRSIGNKLKVFYRWASANDM